MPAWTATHPDATRRAPCRILKGNPVLKTPQMLPRRFVAVATVAVALLPVVASAHAILEESYPSVRGTLPTGDVAIWLRYNSRIDRGRSLLTLIKPDKTRQEIQISADGPPNQVKARLNLPPGDYVLRWQVLAVDGHITRGDLPFRVAGA